MTTMYIMCGSGVSERETNRDKKYILGKSVMGSPYFGRWKQLFPGQDKPATLLGVGEELSTLFPT